MVKDAKPKMPKSIELLCEYAYADLGTLRLTHRAGDVFTIWLSTGLFEFLRDESVISAYYWEDKVYPINDQNEVCSVFNFTCRSEAEASMDLYDSRIRERKADNTGDNEDKMTTTNEDKMTTTNRVKDAAVTGIKVAGSKKTARMLVGVARSLLGDSYPSHLRNTALGRALEPVLAGTIISYIVDHLSFDAKTTEAIQVACDLAIQGGTTEAGDLLLETMGPLLPQLENIAERIDRRDTGPDSGVFE